MIKLVTGILLVLYPIAIYFALKYGHLKMTLLFLLVIFILRLAIMPTGFKQMAWLTKIIAYFGIAMAGLSWIFGQYQLLLYYPVATNLLFLCVFAYSLFRPPTIIERFASIKHPNLPIEAIRYTRKVTLCWCLFFIINGSIALITCLVNDLNWWTLYNGGISYILIGLLASIEWLIRQRVQKSLS